MLPTAASSSSPVSMTSSMPRSSGSQGGAPPSTSAYSALSAAKGLERRRRPRDGARRRPVWRARRRPAKRRETQLGAIQLPRPRRNGRPDVAPPGWARHGDGARGPPAVLPPQERRAPRDLPGQGGPTPSTERAAFPAPPRAPPR